MLRFMPIARVRVGFFETVYVSLPQFDHLTLAHSLNKGDTKGQNQDAAP